MAEIKQDGGGELTIAAMDEDGRLEIGRKTLRFYHRVMMNPVYRQMVKEKVAAMRAAGDPLLTPVDQTACAPDALAGT